MGADGNVEGVLCLFARTFLTVLEVAMCRRTAVGLGSLVVLHGGAKPAKPRRSPGESSVAFSSGNPRGASECFAV